MKKFVAKQKEKHILEFKNNSLLSKPKFAEFIGVSYPTFTSWLYKYEKLGFEGLCTSINDSDEKLKQTKK